MCSSSSNSVCAISSLGVMHAAVPEASAAIPSVHEAAASCTMLRFTRSCERRRALSSANKAAAIAAGSAAAARLYVPAGAVPACGADDRYLRRLHCAAAGGSCREAAKPEHLCHHRHVHHIRAAAAPRRGTASAASKRWEAWRGLWCREVCNYVAPGAMWLDLTEPMNNPRTQRSPQCCKPAPGLTPHLPTHPQPITPCASFPNQSGAVAFGVASILFLTPLISLAVLRLPLQPPELALGLAVFCCMPTALSSGITLTQVCGRVTRLGRWCVSGRQELVVGL